MSRLSLVTTLDSTVSRGPVYDEANAVAIVWARTTFTPIVRSHVDFPAMFPPEITTLGDASERSFATGFGRRG